MPLHPHRACVLWYLQGALSQTPTRLEGLQGAPVFESFAPDAKEFLRKAMWSRLDSEGKEDAVPDKTNDQWTISKQFREDLKGVFGHDAANMTVLEVGSYFGYTTRLLSSLFQKVIALDAIPEFLLVNREFNMDRNNIVYLKFHTLDDDWALFSANLIHVVVLDASHDYGSVRLDIDNVLKIPTVGLIVFDDYGAEEGVRQAVVEYVDRGLLRPVVYLGEQPGWTLRDGRTVDEREAVLCEVLRPSAQPASV
eukprot:gnl/MRDRNA2_/MRDRNA2_97549_c0_seq1.p1 gnl/MRDRNA2_/MRDRNA2_97549_c0~~gnl/MRDRNA2_/MRDRNA2_97549_c0_seq1.p1  ORF type:complete len:281 (+),score=54.86 gnl/MRDRNA2_/MRDRNA2_97549_c0_seq1:90-845(+)